MKKILAVGLVLAVFAGLNIYLTDREKQTDEVSVFPTESELASLEEIFQKQPEPKIVPGALKIPILIYHSVRPDFPEETKLQHEYSITPQSLEKQLLYLQNNGYTAITLDELVIDLQKGTISPAVKPVVLTFDDGWQNQYENAFPLLKKYNMKATFYVYTNPIGKKYFMTWDELREMDHSGMTIASHTLSHPYLKGLPTDKLKKEITESKKVIESQIHKPVLHFASPFGYTSPEIVEIIKAAGYSTGRTAFKGVYHTKEDLFKLRSVLVNDNFDDFLRLLR